MTDSLRAVFDGDSLGALKDPVGLLLLSAGAEPYVHEHTPEDFPRVSTRGHFRERLLQVTPVDPEGGIGRALGLGRERYTAAGHDATDYDTVGNVPGFGPGTGAPDEILVFVHGWMATDEAALGRFATLRHSLEANGYGHPVVGYSWDAHHTATPAGWRAGKAIARWNGGKLAGFVDDYTDRNPDTTVRLVSNSLGAHPLLHALRALDDRGRAGAVETASIMGGTAPVGSVSVDGVFGDAVRNVAGDVYSYRTRHDDTMRRFYRLVEPEEPIGAAAPEPPTPDNLHDRRVDHVPDHFSFYLPESGCVGDIVRDLGMEPPDTVDPSALTLEYETLPGPTGV